VMAAKKNPTRKWFPSQIEDGILALRKFMRGEELSDIRRGDLDYLTRELRLPQPIETYAPRTQRRYVAGARKRRTRNDINRIERQEYQQRKQAFTSTHGSLTVSQWNTIDKLRKQIIALGVDADPYMDDPVIIDFAKLYGYEYLRTVLTQQIDSTQEYINGNRAPGRARWDARGELEERFAASVWVPRITGTDPYYYYHGRK
jgi:hypothetical protein